MPNPRDLADTVLASESAYQVFRFGRPDDLNRSINQLTTIPGAPNPFVEAQQRLARQMRPLVVETELEQPSRDKSLSR